jgi:hypothetical protein
MDRGHFYVNDQITVPDGILYENHIIGIASVTQKNSRQFSVEVYISSRKWCHINSDKNNY